MDAVTKYCLSPQDTHSVRAIVTSYIKWLHQTICCMTAHLRHSIIQGTVGYRGDCLDHLCVSNIASKLRFWGLVELSPDMGQVAHWLFWRVLGGRC